MAIMSALVWYVIPGLIGRAYDLKNETVGPDLFDNTYTVENSRIIEQYMTNSEYRLVTDETEAKDFLDVSGKLALKLKTGGMNIEGTGNYVKDTQSYENRVDVLVKVHFETVTVTLPSHAVPLPEWQKSIEGTGNTHYIRSIKYGGDLVASLSFVTTNEADKEHIKGAIQGELRAKSGSFGSVKGGLEKILNKTRDSSSMSINYFATVPLQSVPRNLSGLVQLVEMFPNQTKKVNGGWGVPLQMEVFSLESLSKDENSYYQTMAFTHSMNMLNEQFTDVKTAKRRLNDWMHSIPPLLSDEMNHKIGEFSSKLQEISRNFSEVISNLDLSPNASASQFDPAFVAYKGDEEVIYPDMYVNKLSNLKVEVLANTEAFEADFGGAIYKYWGGKECPSSTDLTSKGMMFSTIKSSIGTTEFLCLPEEPDYISFSTYRKTGDEDIDDLPQLLPAVFRTRKDSDAAKNVRCATCRIPGKTAVTMLPGKDACPSGWTEQYKGVLVSTDMRFTRSELICLDITQNFTQAAEETDHAVITEVSVSCGDFPCSSTSTSEGKGLACIVCSIKKETKSKAEVFRGL